jgi:hypothetical protein
MGFKLRDVVLHVMRNRQATIIAVPKQFQNQDGTIHQQGMVAIGWSLGGDYWDAIDRGSVSPRFHNYGAVDMVSEDELRTKYPLAWWSHFTDLKLIASAVPMVAVQKPSGLNCKKCNEHFPFAAPNQPDGTMVCWSCRKYPYYRSNA